MRLGLYQVSFLISLPALMAVGEHGRLDPDKCECQRLGLLGLEQVRQMRFAQGARTLELAIEAARREGDREREAKHLNNLGGAMLSQFNYGKALTNFVAARDMARAMGARETEVISWLNMGNLYTMLGAGAAAENALGEALRMMPQESAMVRKLMVLRVRVAARRGSREGALALWTEALDTAQRAGDLEAELDLWDALSMIRMLSGDLDGAEQALANEFRVAVLHKLGNREFLCGRIGRLRLAQSRSAEAVEWFERARKARRMAAGPAIPWVLDQDLAAALAGAGRRDEALRTYREAWKMAVAWRQDVLPTRSADLAADVSLAGLSEQYAALSMSSQRAGVAGAGVREAWAAVEQGRAAGLRRRRLQRKTTLERLDPSYTKLLSRLRQSVVEGKEVDRNKIEARLAELEVRAGTGTAGETAAERGGAENLLRLVQAELGREEALLSFLVGEPRSWVWAVTRENLVWAAVPGRSELRGLVDGFRRSVLENRSDLDTRAEILFGKLFGGLPPEILSRQRWSLSQDDILFECPLGALRSRGEAGVRYLAETHVLRVVPSALWLLHAGSRTESRTLVAVGDAIHNGADPRLRLERPRFAPLSFWVMPWRSSDPAVLDTLELPTLAGSREEVESISGLWRGAGRPVSVLTGAQASAKGVETALKRSPAVLHFATHVVPAEADDEAFLLRLRAGDGAQAEPIWTTAPGDPYLTLSINPEGNREGIDSAILAGTETPGALVVLNGCNSGQGKVLPGAGISGFTSAWLAAGARSVVASLWPVSDDVGEFFAHYYGSILKGSAPADSLRSAQLAMIRQGDWRAKPRYWSAYLSVGKE